MIYPPADIVSVNIPAEGGRGCGQVHERPVVDGVPLHPWPFSCAGGCEQYLLATDSRWVRTAAEIQPTYDQKLEQEHLATGAAGDRESIMVLAMAKLAGLSMTELPASVASTPLARSVVQGSVACPAGHVQSSGANFCQTCGAAMHGPAPAAAVTAS